MSDYTPCQQCQTPNLRGSKFCNNCGASLRPLTILPCPNCQMINRITNFYCDHCGARLVKEELPSAPEAATAEPPSNSPKIFSLPARRPGDTGDLSPHAALDWLKTGEFQSQEPSSALPMEELPDWVSDVRRANTSLLNLLDLDNTADLESDEFTDLLQLDPTDDALPEWLADLPALEIAAETAVAPPNQPKETSLDWLADKDLLLPPLEPSPLEADPDDELFTSDTVGIDDGFDWLTALETADLELPLKRAAAVVPPIEPTPLPATSPAPPAEEEVWTIENFDTESQLPDWLTELQKPSAPAPPAADLVVNEDLPDWVSDMRPTNGSQTDSALPNVVDDEEALFLGDLPDIPAELGEGELPDWLQDIHTPSPLFPEPEAEDETELPVPEPDRPQPAWRDDAPTRIDELSAILSNLPRRSLADMLAKAHIPDWLEALRPANPVDSQIETLQTLQKQGPLAGLRGVVDIEPIVAIPREVPIHIRPFTITEEQQKQAVLLRQLVRDETYKTAVVLATETSAISVRVRLLLAALLLVSIIAGLFWPITTTSQPLPAATQAALTAVDAAAGQPVLLAFEYTPALAGELTPQADWLLERLAANHSPVLTISQSAAGTAVAAARTVNRPASTPLGYLPGGAVGLRQLADCLRQPCPLLVSQPLNANQQASLQNLGLIIVLTGEHDNLLYWLEQVGPTGNVPLVAATTQALAPLAAPYLASGQLVGTLDRTNLNQPTATPNLQTAQAISQLLVALLLLLGGLIFGLAGGSQKK